MADWTGEYDVIYKSVPIARDGLCNYYVPDTGAQKGLLAIHGGSWYFGSKTDMHGLASFYADRGYLVGACNYHLQADGDAAGSHLPRSYEDVRDFILFSQTRYPSITEWYVIGHSAGGQLCFAVHAREDAAFDGVISLDHPSWDMPAMGEYYKDTYLRPWFTDPQLSSESCNLIMQGTGVSQSPTLAFIGDSIIAGEHDVQAQTYSDSYNSGVDGEVLLTPYEHTDLLFRAYEEDNEVSERILEFLRQGPRMTVESAWSSTLLFSTAALVEPPDPGPAPPVQEPATLAPARLGMAIVNPLPTVQMEAYSRYRWTHSTMDYVVPICVRHGKAPFGFSISGISSATITPLAPSWNPAMTTAAEVRIPAGVQGTYTVTVVDQTGASESVTVTIERNDAKFNIITSNFPSIWNEANKDRIIVLRGGSYTTPGADADYCVQIHNERPRSVVGYPGESVTLNANSGSPHGFFNNIGAQGPFDLKAISDLFWSNITFNGGASWFKFLWGSRKHVWYKLHFEDVKTSRLQGSSVSNWGGINYENAGTTGHIGVSIVDVSFNDCGYGDYTNHIGLEFYCTAESHVDMATFTNCRYSCGIRSKSGNQHISLTSIDDWSSNYSYRGACYHTNSNSYSGPLGNVTTNTSVVQMRYSRLAKIPTNGGEGDDESDGLMMVDLEPNKAYGQGYVDRSTVIGWTNPNVSSNTGGAKGYIERSCIMNNRGWGGTYPFIHPAYSDINNLTGLFKNNGWQNLVDEEGRVIASTGQRYKIGYEV